MADEEKKPEEEQKEEVKVEETKPEDQLGTNDPGVQKIEETKEEKKTEKVKEAPAKEEKNVPSGKFKDLIKQIEEMSVSDLAELVKDLEDRFGVSAAVPMAIAGAPGAGAAGSAEEEEKSSYTVMLKDAGAQKIAVIKAVREVNQDLGLVEAKGLVDSAPKEIKKDIPKDEAEEAKKKLEAAGATVELV